MALGRRSRQGSGSPLARRAEGAPGKKGAGRGVALQEKPEFLGDDSSRGDLGSSLRAVRKQGDARQRTGLRAARGRLALPARRAARQSAGRRFRERRGRGKERAESRGGRGRGRGGEEAESAHARALLARRLLHGGRGAGPPADGRPEARGGGQHR